MKPKVPSWAGLAGAVAVAAAGLFWLGARVSAARRTGEEGQTVFFYDESERRIYEVPRRTAPPDVGIGGRPGDGYRATVVAFRGEEADPAKRRVVCLETFAPPLKALMDRVAAAGRAGRPFDGPMPGRTSDFVRTNTLVKRPGDDQWRVAASPEGLLIRSEWKSIQDPLGRPSVICTP